MTWKGKDLAHVLPGPAVYFVLPKALERDQFSTCLGVLERCGRPTNDQVTRDDYWAAITDRAEGRSRWDALRPRYDGPRRTIEDARRVAESEQTVANVLAVRPYMGFAADGLQYTFDFFNPANELEMPYRGAGEPVLALLLGDLTPPAIRYPRMIRDRLAENETFFGILRGLGQVLKPAFVCGASSIMSVLSAYLEGRAASELRPWTLLFPLYLLHGAPIAADTGMSFPGDAVGTAKGRAAKLARVETWSDGRQLIQVRSGLDTDVAWEYFAVARALGMTPIQQVV